MSILQQHQVRVLEEREELDRKVTALKQFFSTSKFSELTALDQSLLRNQARFMEGYLEVLVDRIINFSAKQ